MCPVETAVAVTQKVIYLVQCGLNEIVVFFTQRCAKIFNLEGLRWIRWRWGGAPDGIAQGAYRPKNGIICLCIVKEYGNCEAVLVVVCKRLDSTSASEFVFQDLGVWHGTIPRLHHKRM